MAQVMSRFERQGIEKGIAKGRAEGQREERLTSIRLLIEHRFGALDTATSERIHALTNEQLLALYTAALDFAERADLDRWLAAHPAQS